MSGLHHHGFGSFDPLTGIDSPLHRAPASLKLALSLVIVLLLALTPITPRYIATVFPAVAMLLIIACGIGFIPPLLILKRILILEPVVLCAATLALFQPHGKAVFATIVLRSTLCIATMVILSCTTPFPAIITTLRRWHLPPLMITTLSLMFRFMFLLAEESQRLRRARAARTYSKRHPLLGTASDWLTLGLSTGTLFVRTAARADRVHAAMSSRGWQ